MTWEAGKGVGPVISRGGSGRASAVSLPGTELCRGGRGGAGWAWSPRPPWESVLPPPTHPGTATRHTQFMGRLD